jgi:hypothetical protein
MPSRRRTEITVETERVLIIRRIQRQVEIEGEVETEVEMETELQKWRRIKMIQKKIKRAVLGLLVVTLACGTLLAQSGLVKAHGKHHGTITRSETPSTTGMVTIFSNMLAVTGNQYNDTFGFYVLGPDNSEGDAEQWIAIPFTPAANSHVEELQLAVGIISGTNLLNVTLAADGGGIPGKSLASKTVSNVPEAWTCCKLVTVKFKSPGISVTAGTQYWIVATSDDSFGSTFTGVWQFSNLNWYSGNGAEAGWISSNINYWPAGAASGTIP